MALSVVDDSHHLRPGVTWQPVHWSPDFPRTGTSTYARSPDRLLLQKYTRIDGPMPLNLLHGEAYEFLGSNPDRLPMDETCAVHQRTEAQDQF